MEQTTKGMIQPTAAPRPEISAEQELVKASLLSSNPINGRHSNNGTAHFEVEVQNAFFKIFFNN